MTYPRERTEMDAPRKWQKFVMHRADLFEAIGVPLFLQENKRRFDHWLMHGYHPEDHSGFLSRTMPPQARATLLRLIDAYFEAGFKDPGIMVLTNDELASLSNRPPFANYLYPSTLEPSLQNRKKRKR